MEWIVLVVLLYFLPSVMANGKKGAGGVFVLNLFLGWTIVGWIIALAWAAGAEKTPRLEQQWDCPYCGEKISTKAIKCKHCQTSLIRKEAA